MESENKTETPQNDIPLTNNDEQYNKKYEVVFYVKYFNGDRPDEDQAMKYFSQYGTVDHVKIPQNPDYLFVFMTRLDVDCEHKRTRTVIRRIIDEMDKDNKFYISVAGSRRNKHYNNSYRQYSDYRPMNYNMRPQPYFQHRMPPEMTYGNYSQPINPYYGNQTYNNHPYGRRDYNRVPFNRID